MTHEEAVRCLPEFVEGRLPEADLDRMQGHVDSCDDCRSSAEGYRLIVQALRSDFAFGAAGHPGSDALVAFATGLAAIDPAEHLRVARHVDSCAACAADVDATREMERTFAAPQLAASTEGRGTRAGWRGWTVAAAVAAGMIVGFPVYRVIEGSRTSVASVPAAWSGAVGLPVLSSTLRGGAPSETTVEAPQGQPFVAFALALPPEVELKAGTPLTLALVAASGDRVWQQEIDSGRLAALSGPAGAVLLVVPSSAVSTGSYVLRLSRTGAAAEAPIVEAPLRVTR